jgi:hypothetical protein
MRSTGRQCCGSSPSLFEEHVMQSKRLRRARGEFVSIHPQFNGDRRLVYRFADGRQATARQTRRSFVWQDEPAGAGQSPDKAEASLAEFAAWLNHLYGQ